MTYKPIVDSNFSIFVNYTEFLNKTLQISTFTLLFLSFLLPFAGQLTYVQAQAIEQVKVQVETTDVRNVQEIREITVGELRQIRSLSNLAEISKLANNSPHKLELNEKMIKDIEALGGVRLDNEGQAVVNQQILATIGLSWEQIQLIQTLVASYNSIAIKETIVKIDSNLVKANLSLFGITAKAACQYEHRLTWHWWGAELWLNNCLIEDIKIGTASSAFVAAIAGLEPTPLGELVIGYLGLYIIVLDSKNGQCENRGANLNIPYIGATAMWVSSVC